MWDTRQFNNKADWPTDGSQPFVWSFGDATGYGNHADYVFGWKGDALQKILDTACVVNCAGAKTQSSTNMNKCTQKVVVNENIDGCRSSHQSMWCICTISHVPCLVTRAANMVDRRLLFANLVCPHLSRVDKPSRWARGSIRTYPQLISASSIG